MNKLHKGIIWASILILPFWLWVFGAFGATYYMRADGTAANKAAASGPCGTVGNCMSIATHDADTYSAGDTIILCDDGGTYRDQIDMPSSGSGGSIITYEAASGDTPIISGGTALDGNWASTATETFLSDTFDRSNANDWGTADGGTDADKSWDGGSTDFSILSNYGTTNGTWKQNKINKIGDAHSEDLEITVQIRNLNGISNLENGVIFRYTDANNYYRVTYAESGVSLTGWASSWAIIEVTSGTPALLAQHNDVDDDDCELKVQVENSGSDVIIRVKRWNIGGEEPGSWTFTHTDSTAAMQGATNFGAYVSSSDTKPNFNDFQVDELGGGGGAGIYKISLATETRVVVNGTTFLTEDNGNYATLTNNEWDWHSNELYVNIGEDPTGGNIEAAQRNGVVRLSSKSYIILDGITAQLSNHQDWAGIYGSTMTNFTIQNCVTRWNYMDGILVNGLSGAVVLLIDENTSYYNGGSGIGVASANATTDSTGVTITDNTCYENWENPESGVINGEGIKMFWVNSSTIARNTIYNNHDGGIMLDGDVDTDNGCDSNIVEYNLSYNNGYSGIQVEGGSQSNIVRYNRVYDNGQTGWSGGISAVAKTDNTEIYGNLIWDHVTGAAIMVGDNSEGTLIYNNIAKGSTWGFYVAKLDSAVAKNVKIKNNIFYGSGSNRALYILSTDYTGFKSDYNDFYNVAGVAYGADWWTITQYRDNTNNADNTIEANPLFTNAAGDDFTLKFNSPCRHGATHLSGYETKLRPEASWPDNVTTMDDVLSIGAYGIYRGSAGM